MKKIVLLTTIHEKWPDAPERALQIRAAEFEECLANNCKTDIDRIIVFFEGDEEAVSRYPSFAHEKVEVIFIRERPKYSLFFDYANEYLAGNFIIISNGDIYFDPETPVNRIREIKPDYLWSLSRYELGQEPGSREHCQVAAYGSYDSYIFYAPLKKFKDDILIGVLGCDSYLVQKAFEASIPVSNPSLSLVTRHIDRVFKKSVFAREHCNANSYWDMPDYGGFPGVWCWPHASRIEDSDYRSFPSPGSSSSYKFRMAYALSRMFGKKSVFFVIKMKRLMFGCAEKARLFLNN